MKHIIISDTHAPKCAERAMEYTREILVKIPEIDAIVINGDLLGIFSMTQSCLHKGGWIGKEEIDRYLKSAAPKFYEKFKSTGEVTPRMVLEYVSERYQWCLDILAKFALMKKTIFNMGNHESDVHFLVLQEIPFLTGCNPDMIYSVNKDTLMKIFKGFESSLYEMEKMYELRYIRDNHIIQDDTIIMGIPGENHSTADGDYASNIQENKTKEIIGKVKCDLGKVSSIIIYNHTQGDYDPSTGKFHTASPSLRQFMDSLPENIKTKVFVQSHNHWNHTQFMMDEGFCFIMNNAGLHNGLFNIVDFGDAGIVSYDADPINKKVIKLKLSTELSPISDPDELIARNYPDADHITIRKNINTVLNTILN